MKIENTTKEKRYGFMEYDKGKSCLVECGKDASVKVGNKYVCRDHLKHSIANSKDVEMIKLDGKHAKTVNEFLADVDGVSYKDPQNSLF